MATLGLSEAEKDAVERLKRDVIEPSMTSLVILDFWAEWCGPCKQLAPVLDKVAADYADKGVILAKIDIDQDKLIAAQFRIQSIPTVYAFFQGQPVADLTNYRTEGQLTRVLDQLLAQLPVKGAAQDLQAQVEPMIVQGEEALDAGDAAQAESIFRQLLALDPDAPAGVAGLARALIATGQIDEARDLLASVETGATDHPAIGRARAALDLASAPTADVSEEEARLAANPDDHDARFAIAQARLAAGDRDSAAEALLEIIARDRDWNDGAARARLLQMLEAVGFEDTWGRQVRRRLSAVLFT